MIRCIVFAAVLALASAPLCATTYTLESPHTEGIVRWSHLGFSNPTAQFSQVTGTVDYDAADPTHSSVTATIQLAHMSSGVPDLDDNFHSDDFFDIAKFPTATFKSTKVEKGDASDKLIVTGDLTLHGITKAVTLQVTINKIGINPRINLPSIGFDASASLKRSDFGLGMYVPQVSDDVSLYITAQGDEEKGYAKHLKEAAATAAEDAKTQAKQAAQTGAPTQH